MGHGLEVEIAFGALVPFGLQLLQRMNQFVGWVDLFAKPISPLLQNMMGAASNWTTLRRAQG
jgi:hypothetical protein